MRRLFFIICCFLALDICLAGDWWKDNFIIGAHWGPPLHHKNNNVDSPLVRNFTLLKDGGFNYILGKMNSHNYIANSFLENNLDYLVGECKDTCDNNNMFFLNDTADLHNLSDPTLIEFGLNIKDEPSLKDSTLFLTKVQNLKQNHPDLLGFINLLPSHGLDSFVLFKRYVNAYLRDTTLQVACFDNYYPNSEFSPRTSFPRHSNYYANLAYMKHAAGSRPLWAYLRSSEVYVEEKDSTWQDAYIRLGAFAPLAFGAQGIIYFSYDCKDRNLVRRSPGRGSWESHDFYFDNDEMPRQIFFGNIKNSTTSPYPDLAIHTNDSLGTWRIKETDDDGTEDDMKMITIGTWFGDHIHNMPNIYNWDFNPNGQDKFTTIQSSRSRLLLSKFRSGWTHYAELSNFPIQYWSTMNRHTCPFGDFNRNQQFDLCLGWTENGHGKLRIYMDCHNDPSHTPTPRDNPMLFDKISQTFTFSDPLKQVITRNDSIYVITSNPDSSYTKSDSLHILKYISNQFNVVYTHKITLPKKMDHYWMEETLYGQSDNGTVWGEASGQELSLTNDIPAYSSREIYVWGQYNKRTNQYDRYGIAPDGREYYQTYALLNRKGNPNRIYHTAQAINRFINDSTSYATHKSIKSIIMKSEWIGAYFSSKPYQEKTELLNIIKDTTQTPIPLIYNNSYLSDNILFGLYKDKLGVDLDLLVINMQESSRDLTFTHSSRYDNNSYHCNKITRMYTTENPPADSTVTLNNMLGGECAILHFTINQNP